LEPLITISRVSKEYASGGEDVVRALRDVSLGIEAGEFVAVVGTSGSGKSTLMNVLGCLDRPTFGTYTLADIEAGARGNDARALIRNRLIGFVFQGFNLLPRTTALENVELPLVYRGVPAAARRKRATAALEAVGLGDRLGHTPNQLSGGQQQRVAIARALVTDPPLLLADEPTGNLDTRTSLEVLALLQRLNRERGITVVLVTHEHDIAACAGRVITFRDGRILSDVRQDAPVDAGAEVRALPPPEAHARAEDADDDPAVALRKRLGGPVPASVYFAGALGLLLGAAAGAAYGAFVLDAQVPALTAALAVAGDAWASARAGRRKLGRPLTFDQRARVAIFGALAWLALAGGFFAVAVGRRKPVWAATVGEALVARGPVVALLFVLALAVATALLRGLLLSLTSPRR